MRETGLGRGFYFFEKIWACVGVALSQKNINLFSYFFKKNHRAKQSVRSPIIMLEQFFHGGIEIAPYIYYTFQYTTRHFPQLFYSPSCITINWEAAAAASVSR